MEPWFRDDPSEKVDPNQVWPLDRLWYPEDKIQERIIFMMMNGIVPLRLVRRFAGEVFKGRQMISRSKYLTPDIIMFLGDCLDWTLVKPEFYTPEIIRKYIERVNLKFVLIHKDFDQVKDLPEVIKFKSEIDDLIVEYLEKKVEMIDNIAKKEFNNQRKNNPHEGACAVPREVDMHEEMLKELMDDDGEEGEDGIDVLRSRHLAFYSKN